MSLPLDSLLGAIIAEEVYGNTHDVVISDLTFDSRKVTPGSMFVAVRGVNVDGHAYIDKAIEQGATAVVCETLPVSLSSHTVFVKVANSAVALGALASQWYDNPSRKLKLVGVTGTNGKTTIATLMYEMARMMGHKAGLISTVANIIDEERIPADHTTPDPITINRLMREMVDCGCTFAAMEVSSHACAQCRIAGLHFVGGIFTNLTRDHLDYHGTVAAYLAAKKSFFDTLPQSAFALTNIDDPNGCVMLQNCNASHHTYSIRRAADYTGHIIESRIDGTLISFNGTEVETLFIGGYNAQNLTAVYGASLLCGFDREKVLVAMSALTPVSGRFETIRSSNGITVVVDYAHTPDAIENVLNALGEIKGSSQIITVTGAGGNRDKGKRPIMARKAFERSSRLIITSDNPRDEKPEDIAAEMLEGIDPAQRHLVLTILDRRQAIRTAVAIATPGDIILIAGKGHETYQEISGVKHHFDDREEARSALNIN